MARPEAVRGAPGATPDPADRGRGDPSFFVSKPSTCQLLPTVAFTITADVGGVGAEIDEGNDAVTASCSSWVLASSRST